MGSLSLWPGASIPPTAITQPSPFSFPLPLAFAFDLSPDLTDDEKFDQQRTGSVRLQLKFSPLFSTFRRGEEGGKRRGKVAAIIFWRFYYIRRVWIYCFHFCVWLSVCVHTHLNGRNHILFAEKCIPLVREKFRIFAYRQYIIGIYVSLAF